MSTSMCTPPLVCFLLPHTNTFCLPVCPPPHLCFCSHLCVLCINSFWTFWNVENRRMKFVVSEITFYRWMSALKKSEVKMAPREVCRLWHMLAFLVPRAGLVCGFTLWIHPVLQQLVLCKLLDFVWGPFRKTMILICMSWFEPCVIPSLSCVPL